MAGDSVRESAVDTNRLLRDAAAGGLISIEQVQAVTGVAAVVGQIDAVGETFTAEALEGAVPAQAEVVDSTKLSGPFLHSMFMFPSDRQELVTYPDPEPHVSPGEKITRAFAERFIAAYGEIIQERAEAVAERASPFAVEGSIKITVFATVEGLLRWGRGGVYHRGLTEEYFTVAAVTYQKIDGDQVSIPIHFHWDTHTVTPWFIASKVGQ